MLPRCLSAAAPVVDEIVIVDTGSTDTTIEIARSFGAKVIEREWTGSFAHARNASLQAATGDWLLYLDADEILVSDDAAALRALAGRTWREAFMLREINYTGSGDPASAVTNDALRIVRNRPQYRFQGALHEQIAWSLPTHLPERIESTEIRIERFGYLDEVRQIRGKTQRNIELLNAEADGRTEVRPALQPRLRAARWWPARAGDPRVRACLAADRTGPRARPAPLGAHTRDPARQIPGRRRETPAGGRARGVGARTLPRLHRSALRASALARGAWQARAGARPLQAMHRDGGRAHSLYGDGGCGSHLPRMLIAELLEVFWQATISSSFEQLLPLLEAVSPPNGSAARRSRACTCARASLPLRRKSGWPSARIRRTRGHGDWPGKGRAPPADARAGHRLRSGGPCLRARQRRGSAARFDAGLKSWRSLPIRTVERQPGEAAQGRDRKRHFQEEQDMSSLIQPSQALPSTPRTTSVAPSGAMRASLAPQTSPLSESEAPVSLDTLPSTPRLTWSPRSRQRELTTRACARRATNSVLLRRTGTQDDRPAARQQRHGGQDALTG